MSDASRTPGRLRPMRGQGARARVRAVAAAVAVAVLAGCASSGSPSEPVDWDATLDLGAPGDVIETVTDVRYYPACGNEVLRLDGQVWFPFTPANSDGFPGHHVALGGPPLGFARASAPAPRTVARAAPVLVAVAPPGAGDDTGTLTSYEGGFAFWVSESGALDTWLTTSEIEYAWVC